jgi:predicted AAA+ superfamily ATPase
MKYVNRIIEKKIKENLSVMGAVVIEGIKACGKTETGRIFAKSEIRLDIDEEAKNLALISPRSLLSGEVPRLIDEWQVVSELWNYVRHEIDDRQDSGQFILTGSSNPMDEITRHSGAGRFARLRMRPLSLSELGLSNSEISLESLLNNELPNSQAEARTLEDMMAIVCKGGLPSTLSMSLNQSLLFMQNYVTDLTHIDLDADESGESRMSPQKVLKTLSSIARNIASPVNISTLMKDSALNRSTVEKNLNMLERLMIVENQPSWGTHLRSSKRVQASPKLHFADPSIAVGLLKARPETLIKDLKTFGLLFESMVVRDLRVYSDAIGATVSHFRQDGNHKRGDLGLEVDAIVDAGDTRWAAFEIKLSARQEILDEAAKNLLNFANKIDTEKSSPPASLNIITGLGEYAYRRKDGVNIIPITALGV